MKKVDIEHWNRKEHYHFFSGVDYPFYAVTIPINITRVREVARAKQTSFYHLMIWICTKALNSVPAFKMRMIDNELYELENIHPSFTTMEQGEEVFKIITMPWEEDFELFSTKAKEISSKQTSLFGQSELKDEVIYFSCTPWFDFTALTNERNMNKDDMIPRLGWGKYYNEGDELFIHLSIDVNHRVVDGLHIGKLKEAIDREIAQLS